VLYFLPSEIQVALICLSEDYREAPAFVVLLLASLRDGVHRDLQVLARQGAL
jgi:hypothetical protein